MSFDKSFEKTWRLKSPSCFYCAYFRPSEHKKLFGYCFRHGVPLLFDWAQVCEGYTLIPERKIVSLPYRELTTPPNGKQVTRKHYTVDDDDDIETIEYYDGSELLFTLTYHYTTDGKKNLEDIIRS